MREHIGNRLTQRRVRFDLFLLELAFEPLVQLLHQRLAVALMPSQSILGREPLLASPGIGLVDLGQSLEHVLHFVGKVLRDIDEPAPAVAEAVGEDRRELAGIIARERIAHVNGGRERLGPLLQHRLEVLAGVMASGEKQRDQMRPAR